MRAAVTYLCLGLIGAAISLILHFNWEVRARVLLATEGLLFVKLVSPVTGKDLDGSGGYFVSKLVFENGDRIGFLDPYGDFLKPGEKLRGFGGMLWYLRLCILLFLLSGIIFVFGLISLVKVGRDSR